MMSRESTHEGRAETIGIKMWNSISSKTSGSLLSFSFNRVKDSFFLPDVFQKQVKRRVDV